MPRQKPLLEDELIAELLIIIAKSDPTENYATKISEKIGRERAFVYKRLIQLSKKKLVEIKKADDKLNNKTLFVLNIQKLKELCLKVILEIVEDRLKGYQVDFLKEKCPSELQEFNKIFDKLKTSKFLDDTLIRGLKNAYYIYKSMEFNLDHFFSELFVALFNDRDIFEKHLKKNYPDEEEVISKLITILKQANRQPLYSILFTSELIKK